RIAAEAAPPQCVADDDRPSLGRPPGYVVGCSDQATHVRPQSEQVERVSADEGRLVPADRPVRFGHGDAGLAPDGEVDERALLAAELPDHAIRDDRRRWPVAEDGQAD